MLEIAENTTLLPCRIILKLKPKDIRTVLLNPNDEHMEVRNVSELTKTPLETAADKDILIRKLCALGSTKKRAIYDAADFVVSLPTDEPFKISPNQIRINVLKARAAKEGPLGITLLSDYAEATVKMVDTTIMELPELQSAESLDEVDRAILAEELQNFHDQQSNKGNYYPDLIEVIRKLEGDKLGMDYILNGLQDYCEMNDIRCQELQDLTR
jgi:hypothetical protein